MGFLGSQGFAAACTGARWAPSVPLPAWLQSPGSSCCQQALEQQLPLGLVLSLGWGKITKNLHGMEKGWATPGCAPGWTGWCLAAHTELPCGSATAQSIWRSLEEMF